MTWRLALWFIVAMLPYAIGEYWSKRWGNEGTFNVGLYTVISYFVSSLGWLGIMRTSNKLFIMGLILQAIGAIIGFVIGVVLFSERLTRFEIIGTCLVLVGLGFIALSE